MEISDPVADNARQTTEPDPSEVLPDDDVETVMAKLIDQAKPGEREKLNAMNAKERRALAKTYLEQARDVEPSPLDGDAPGRRRQVKQHKRV